MRIRLISQGKTKNAQLRALEADYSERIKHFTELKLEESLVAAKPGARNSGNRKGELSASERHLLEKLGESCYKVFLDVSGQHWTSEAFAAWLGEQAARGTKEIVFLVGAPEGFSSAFKSKATLLLSLSRMTFTRDWARVLLLEQIYRGFAILRGYPYAK